MKRSRFCPCSSPIAGLSAEGSIVCSSAIFKLLLRVLVAPLQQHDCGSELDEKANHRPSVEDPNQVRPPGRLGAFSRDSRKPRIRRSAPCPLIPTDGLQMILYSASTARRPRGSISATSPTALLPAPPAATSTAAAAA